MKRTESNYAWKRGLPLYQRAPFCLTKWHLDNPKSAGGGQIPPNRKLFLTLSIQIKKIVFF